MLYVFVWRAEKELKKKKQVVCRFSAIKVTGRKFVDTNWTINMQGAILSCIAGLLIYYVSYIYFSKFFLILFIFFLMKINGFFFTYMKLFCNDLVLFKKRIILFSRANARTKYNQPGLVFFYFNHFNKVCTFFFI